LVIYYFVCLKFKTLKHGVLF